MTDPRPLIRAWWTAQLATGQPVDLDTAAAMATDELLRDPAFVAAIADQLVKPMVRDIGQRTVQQRNGNRTHPERVQIGSTVMSRQQAIALVDRQLGTSRPHWSQLVQRDNEHLCFLALGRDELMREATRRKEQGVDRLREATFLLAVANNLGGEQIVADVWEEQELDLLFAGIEVDVTARRGNVTFAFQFDKQKAIGAKAS